MDMLPACHMPALDTSSTGLQDDFYASYPSPHASESYLQTSHVLLSNQNHSALTNCNINSSLGVYHDASLHISMLNAKHKAGICANEATIPLLISKHARQHDEEQPNIGISAIEKENQSMCNNGLDH